MVWESECYSLVTQLDKGTSYALVTERRETVTMAIWRIAIKVSILDIDAGSVPSINGCHFPVEFMFGGVS